MKSSPNVPIKWRQHIHIWITRIYIQNGSCTVTTNWPITRGVTSFGPITGDFTTKDGALLQYVSRVNRPMARSISRKLTKHHVSLRLTNDRACTTWINQWQAWCRKNWPMTALVPHGLTNDRARNHADWPTAQLVPYSLNRESAHEYDNRHCWTALRSKSRRFSISV